MIGQFRPGQQLLESMEVADSQRFDLGRKRIGSGGPLGLQIRRASSKGGVAGFDSQALPPFSTKRRVLNRIRGELTNSWAFVAVLMTSAVLVAGCAARASFEERLIAEDQRITAEVIRIIEDEKGIIAADLRVETKEGVVVLYGIQSEMESISAVLRRISRVRGVVEVINRIRIIRAEAERSNRKNLHSL